MLVSSFPASVPWSYDLGLLSLGPLWGPPSIPSPEHPCILLQNEPNLILKVGGVVNDTFIGFGALGSKFAISISGNCGAPGKVGVLKGVTLFTLILGGVTVIGNLVIFLGFTDVPNSIVTIGSWFFITLANP